MILSVLFFVRTRDYWYNYIKFMQNQYGIDVNTLEKFIITPETKKTDWGSFCEVVSVPEYKLERLEIARGKSTKLAVEKDREATIFVEEGKVLVNEVELVSQEIITAAPQTKNKVSAVENSVVYVFSGEASGENYDQKFKPTDFREKYWGSIETIVSREYAAKRMLVRKGQHASLEYHCRKLESYFIHGGKLLLRLRAGRGEDKYFEMPAGSANLTPPGLMHQRAGLADTVIIEISTRDEDSDSYLVEDGKSHPLPYLTYLLLKEKFGDKKPRKICFDIDGVLRTQTEGDYENAQPVWEAIKLVNKLYDEGHKITLYTSSFMGRSKSDPHTSYNVGYEWNKNQLAKWGVKYHDLFMGKPPTDVLIDDRALFFTPDWQLIEKEIRGKISSAEK